VELIAFWWKLTRAFNFFPACKTPKERKQEKGSKIDLFLLARQKKITIFFHTFTVCVLRKSMESLSSPRGRYFAFMNSSIYFLPWVIKKNGVEISETLHKHKKKPWLDVNISEEDEDSPWALFSSVFGGTTVRNFGRSSPATISFWLRLSGDDFCTGTNEPVIVKTWGGGAISNGDGASSTEHCESHSETSEKKRRESEKWLLH
jgi:hypothetical protein